MNKLVVILLFLHVHVLAQVESIESIYNKSQEFIDQKDYDQAQAYLIRGVTMYPDEPSLLFNLIQVYKQKNDLTALLLATEEYRRFGFDKAVATIQSQAYYDAKDFTKCINLCKEILGYYPRNEEANLLLAHCFRDTKQFPLALGQYRKCIEMNISPAVTYFEAGNIYRDNHDYENAKYYLKQAISYNPKNAYAYLELGKAFFDTENYTLAMDNYYQAMSLAPKDGDIAVYMGNLYFSVPTFRSFEKALNFYLLAINNQTKDSAIYYKIGWIYNNQKLFNKAKEYLLIANEYNPKDKNYLTELGYTYYQMQEYNNAIAYLEKAIQLDVKDDYILYYLAKSYLAINDIAKYEATKNTLLSMQSAYIKKL